MRQLLEDGRMMYLRRGIPREAPDGFIGTSDPFIFAPIRDACINIRDDLEIGCSGRLITIFICLKTGKKIQQGDCYLCEGYQKEPDYESGSFSYLK